MSFSTDYVYWKAIDSGYNGQVECEQFLLTKLMFTHIDSIGIMLSLDNIS